MQGKKNSAGLNGVIHKRKTNPPVLVARNYGKEENKMNKREKNKIAMIESVVASLDQKKEEFTGLPGITSAMALLKEKRDELFAKEQERIQVSVGTVQTKKFARKNAEEKANTVAAALNSLAIATGNTILREKTDLTIHAIGKLRDVELVIFLNTARTAAMNAIGELAAYGYSQNDLDELINASEEYYDAIRGKETGKSDRVSAKAAIKTIFEETDEVIKRVDKIIESFRTKKPDLYNAYRSSRKIYDYGTRKKKQPQENPSQ